MKTDDN